VIKLLLAVLSLFLISFFSGLKIGPPPTLESATFFSPIHIAQTFFTRDNASLEIYRELRAERVGIWQRPGLAGLLVGHTALMIFLLWRIRKGPEDLR
jgi:hypothetical protein